MQATPLSLLLRLSEPEGEETARDWSRFVELFGPLLYNWAERLGLQTQDAADLVQNVFTVLVRKLPEFRHNGRQSFRGWLRVLQRNLYRDQCRRPAPPVSVAVEVLDNLPDPDTEPDLEEAEYRKYLVHQALRLMQRDFQPATWRACWETKVCGRPAIEVAAELGLTVAAVHAATSRVLRRLRQELDGFLD